MSGVPSPSIQLQLSWILVSICINRKGFYDNIFNNRTENSLKNGEKNANDDIDTSSFIDHLRNASSPQ